MTNLLLIDDDSELSGMLTDYLAREGFATTAVASGGEGVLAALSGRFNAVILDVMLPDLTGFEVLRKIKGASAIPIIMLTAKGSDVDRVVGLEMGADDYVAKPYYPRELVARIRAVLRRPPWREPVIASAIAGWPLTLSKPRREVAWRGTPIGLTVTEFKILEILMTTGESVATKDDISRHALGRIRESYDRSVDVHISNLRRKLGVASGGALEVETMRGIGYRLRYQP
jgi:two-component system OmpR family response regulator